MEVSLFCEILHPQTPFSFWGYLKVRFAELLFTLSSGEPGCTMECLTLRPQLERRAGNMVGVGGEGCVWGSKWGFQLCGHGPCNIKPTWAFSWGTISLSLCLSWASPCHTHCIPAPSVCSVHAEDLPETLMHRHFQLNLRNSELGRIG